MDIKKRIEAINEHLKAIGSRFEAVTETRLSRHLGGLTWIKRDFESLESMETFVFNIQ